MKTAPNEPCPCGSGKKYKKCCGAVGATALAEGASYGEHDRTSARRRLEPRVRDLIRGINDLGPDQEHDARWSFEHQRPGQQLFGRYLDQLGELPEDLLCILRDVLEAWVSYDRAGPGGTSVAERLLEDPQLPGGERAYLSTMKATALRIYEAVAVSPGTSVTLRSVLDGDSFTVMERMASRSIQPSEWLAARVVPCGVPGKPEMEAGLLRIPAELRDATLRLARQHRDDTLRDHPGTSTLDADKRLAPALVQLLLGSLFEPPPHAAPAPSASSTAPLDPQVEAALIQPILDRHYRSWVDVPVPALDGKTPRQAAAIPRLRRRLLGMVEELEASHARDLAAKRPSHDPSWMRGELGLPPK